MSDVRKVVSPVLVNDKNSSIYHIDFSFDEQRLGGSAFAQSLGFVGDDVPTVKNPEYFAGLFQRHTGHDTEGMDNVRTRHLGRRTYNNAA